MKENEAFRPFEQHEPALKYATLRGDFRVHLVTPRSCLAISLVIFIALSSACRDTATSAAYPASPPWSAADTVVQIPVLEDFSAAFHVVDSFTLEQSREHVVANVHSVTLDEANNRLLIVDASENNVKEYDLRGQLRMVYGASGQGPGEFQAVSSAAVDDKGRVLVLDPNLRRVTLFNSDGHVARIVGILTASALIDFGVTSTNEYVFLSLKRPSDSNVLVVTDSMGNEIRSALPLANIVPPGEVNGPEWQFPRMFSLALRRDTAMVVVSLLSRLWLSPIAEATMRTADVSFIGYTPPRQIPSSAKESATALHTWFYGRDLGGFLASNSVSLYWLFIRGELWDNKPMILLQVGPERESRGYSDAPMVLAAFENDRLLVFRDPAAATPTFVVYERQR